MRRLSKEEKEEIKKSDEPHKVIARRMNLNPNTIKFHKSEEFRKKLREYQKRKYNELSRSKRKEIQERKKEYMKKYHKNRYKNDEEFRNKQIERVIRNRKWKNQNKDG